jgi:hypothetical protein
MVKTSSCWVVCILWNCLFNSKMYSSTLCFLSFVANLYVVATCITYPTCPIVWEKATKKPQVFFHSLEASHPWCRNSLHTHELQTFGACDNFVVFKLVTNKGVLGFIPLKIAFNGVSIFSMFITKISFLCIISCKIGKK